MPKNIPLTLAATLLLVSACAPGGHRAPTATPSSAGPSTEQAARQAIDLVKGQTATNTFVSMTFSVDDQEAPFASLVTPGNAGRGTKTTVYDGKISDTESKTLSGPQGAVAEFSKVDVDGLVRWGREWLDRHCAYPSSPRSKGFVSLDALPGGTLMQTVSCSMAYSTTRADHARIDDLEIDRPTLTQADADVRKLTELARRIGIDSAEQLHIHWRQGGRTPTDVEYTLHAGSAEGNVGADGQPCALTLSWGGSQGDDPLKLRCGTGKPLGSTPLTSIRPAAITKIVASLPEKGDGWLVLAGPGERARWSWGVEKHFDLDGNPVPE